MFFRRQDVEGPRRVLRAPLPRLPVKLKPSAPPLRALLAFLWLACLVLAIAAQAGASWRVYQHRHYIALPFASLGLAVYDARDRVNVGPASSSARQNRISFSNVRSINRQDIPPHESAEEIARRLVGPDGGSVTLGLTRFDRSRQDVRLVRTAENRMQVRAEDGWFFTIVSQWIDVLVALFLLAAAAVFRFRRFKDPVSILVSFALLFLATVGTHPFWRWAGLYYAEYVLDGIWITLLLAAIPALPGGRYVPAWTRWLFLAGPLGEALMAFRIVARPELVRGFLILMVILCVILRFRFTSRSAERQKMKWASLGLGIGLLLCAAGQMMMMHYASLPFPRDIQQLFSVGGYGLNRAAFVIMALGLLVSLLDYRLNDADAAIGRSAGYAAVTALVVVVWAVSAAWSDRLIKTYTGNANPELAVGISTLVALAILAPARSRALAWTEAYFQRALVRLRSLPERIARWRDDDDPAAVAERALRAIADGVEAVDAAIVAYPDERQPQVIGAHNISQEAVTARLRKRRPRARAADEFPLRVDIRSYSAPPMTLLIGRRSDRAFYSRQERAAVSAIAEPLADALHAVSRRAAQNAALNGALAQISVLLQQMQGATATPQRRKKPSRKVCPSR